MNSSSSSRKPATSRNRTGTAPAPLNSQSISKSSRGGASPSGSGINKTRTRPSSVGQQNFGRNNNRNYKSPSSTTPLQKKKSLKRVTLSEQVEIDGLKRPLPSQAQDGSSNNRSSYIDYALDMVTHNLIGSGQLTPSQSHLVKTPEMKSHINSLLDRVESNHSKGRATHINSHASTHKTVPKKWALQPHSLPITIITDKDPTAKPVRRPNAFSFRPSSPRRPSSSPKRPSSSPRSRAGTSRKRSSNYQTTQTLEKKKRTNVLSVPISNKAKSGSKSKLNTSVSLSSSLRKTGSKKTVRLGGSQSQTSKSLMDSVMDSMARANFDNANEKPRPDTATSSTFTEIASGSENELAVSDSYSYNRFEPEVILSNDGRFRAKFDMRGFENEEIALDLKDRTLTVTGARPKRDDMNERKTSETVDIPTGVNLERLKVARRIDGILLIQESPLES